MSSISNFPYGKVLDYWYEKLRGYPFRNRFLLTKLLETAIFKFYGSNKLTLGTFDEPILPPKSKTQKISESPRISLVVPVFLRTAKDKN